MFLPELGQKASRAAIGRVSSSKGVRKEKDGLEVRDGAFIDLQGLLGALGGTVEVWGEIR